MITHIAALRAEKVADMPLSTTSDNNLSLDGRLAALAPGTEEFMEIQVAVEPQRVVAVVQFGLSFNLLDFLAIQPALDAVHTGFAFGRRLGVEGDALKSLVAMEAGEAVRMETNACGADDLAGDW